MKPPHRPIQKDTVAVLGQDLTGIEDQGIRALKVDRLRGIAGQDPGVGDALIADTGVCPIARACLDRSCVAGDCSAVDDPQAPGAVNAFFGRTGDETFVGDQAVFIEQLDPHGPEDAARVGYGIVGAKGKDAVIHAKDHARVGKGGTVAGEVEFQTAVAACDRAAVGADKTCAIDLDAVVICGDRAGIAECRNRPIAEKDTVLKRGERAGIADFAAAAEMDSRFIGGHGAIVHHNRFQASAAIVEVDRIAARNNVTVVGDHDVVAIRKAVNPVQARDDLALQPYGNAMRGGIVEINPMSIVRSKIPVDQDPEVLSARIDIDAVMPAAIGQEMKPVPEDECALGLAACHGQRVVGSVDDAGRYQNGHCKKLMKKSLGSLSEPAAVSTLLTVC